MSEDYGVLKGRALEELSSAIDSAITYGEQLRFDKESFHHQLMIGSYLGMTEISDGIRVLLDANKSTEADILLRTQFELRVRIAVFAEHKDIAMRERIVFAKRNLRVLETAKDENRYLAKVSENIDIDSEILRLNRDIRNLKNEGVKDQLKFHDMCHQFGFKEEHASIYSGLSQAPHGTYSSIIDRNFIVDHQTKDFKVTAFRLPEINVVQRISNQSAQMLIAALSILKDFLSSSFVEQPLDTSNR